MSPAKAEKSVKTENRLQALSRLGQSVWLDFIRRSLLKSGDLTRLIEEDGLAGMTSNPAIFEKAIAGGAEYAADLKPLQARGDVPPMRIYEALAIKDIQDAADILRPVYDRTRKKDGYVSMEVSPYLARDTRHTIEEARRLWKAVGRENLMIKVPGTPEGIPAIQTLIAEGINVNVTLLFSRELYEKAAWAYIAGLEERAARGQDVSGIAGVASFFVSRIDTAADALLSERLKSETDKAKTGLIRGLMGKIAIANAKLAYRLYQKIIADSRWKALAAKGAMPQRLLWASTSTKNPKYNDVMYVEDLIGPDTVNTVPPATLDAFRDHGRASLTLAQGWDEAERQLAALESLSISLEEVTGRVLEEGLLLFSQAFDKLLDSVDARAKDPKPDASRLGTLSFSLPAALDKKFRAALSEWSLGGKARRLWSRDAGLWTGTDEAGWMGWLDIVEEEWKTRRRLADFQAEVKKAGWTHALLLGMGGSSLCPEVLAKTFGLQAGFPELLVLDSTDPDQIRGIQAKIDLKRTLFIVSSKSGSTLEPNILMDYFWSLAVQAHGEKKAGACFAAVTDPGSSLEKIAAERRFWRVFHGDASIGGRYSALSDFGLAPAAAMGLDAARFLESARAMSRACAGHVSPDQNPGVLLGVLLGTAAREGRDKATFIASPGVSDLGAWLEQLLAESTGKDGRGIIPVDREPAGKPAVYGQDRLFVYLRLDCAPEKAQDEAVSALEKAGQPVVRVGLREPYAVGQEFFRWEIATAAAGAVLGINPFNQPDVEASKIETRKLMEAYEKTGALPAEAAFFEEGGVRLFADQARAAALKKDAGAAPALASYLKAYLAELKPGDYFAFLAYLDMSRAHERDLTSLRVLLREKKRSATCLGFGPRFQHSTGQAYKGGPATGVFLQLTAESPEDLPVPGRRYAFGAVKLAQARGDFAVLSQRGRRVLRAHLGQDADAGLKILARAFHEALSA